MQRFAAAVVLDEDSGEKNTAAKRLQAVRAGRAGRGGALLSPPPAPGQGGREGGRQCLPQRSGSRVSLVELAKGGESTDAAAAALLAERPELQHLEFSTAANSVTVSQVSWYLCCVWGGASHRCRRYRLPPPDHMHLSAVTLLSLVPEVTIYKTTGFLYIKYEDAPITGIILYATPTWCALQPPHRCPTATQAVTATRCCCSRCIGTAHAAPHLGPPATLLLPCPSPLPDTQQRQGRELLFGGMVAFVDTSASPERRKPENLCASVRWYKTESETANSKLLKKTRWCYQLPNAAGARRSRGRTRVPYFDLVPLADIVDPVFLQR